MLTRLYIATDIRVRQAIANKDRGQGTLEYLGVVVIVALLVGAAIIAFREFELGDKLNTQLNKILDNA